MGESAECLGEVGCERIQLNEDSLWTGDEHDSRRCLSDHGRLVSRIDAGSKPQVFCPSGQRLSMTNRGIGPQMIIIPATKWCGDMGRQTRGLAGSGGARAAAGNSYTLQRPRMCRSAIRVRGEYSRFMDNQNWTVLDKHDDEPPFENRGQSKTFSYTDPTAYRFYRNHLSEK